MNIGRKISTYTKALGLSAVIGLGSCGEKINTTAHVNMDTISCSTKKLISILERGDRQATRIVNVPPNTRVIKADEILKYAPNDTLGALYYKVYAGKADKAIRKTNKEEGVLVTVGQGITGLNSIKLANGQKAYEGDFISEKVADSLLNVAINQKDSILRANIADSTYKKLKQNEKDAVIAYLYNVNESLLQKAPKGKSFFENLSEGNMGIVQSKFNVSPSAECAKAGLAKRNLVKLLIFGNGKIYPDKAAQNNFNKQINIVKKHKKGTELLKEVFDMVKQYGVDKINLEKTKKMVFNK